MSEGGDGLSEVVALREQLREAEDVLRAIRAGEADALVIDGPCGQQVYSLKGAEQPYRLIIEEMSEGAATVGEDGTLLYCNRHLADMLACPLERVIGSPLRRFVSENDVPEVQALLRVARERPGRAEVSLRTADARELPVRMTANPLPSDIGGCTSVIMLDLSEERRTRELIATREALRESESRLRRALDAVEEHSALLETQVVERTRELRDSHERLRHAERMASLGTLAAGLGHDLANTLLPLRIRLESMERDPGLSARSREDVQAVRVFAEHLASLARGLRMFARDPSQGDEEGRTPVARWVGDVGRLLASSVRAPIRVTCEAAKELPDVLFAAHRLTQSVLNLVHNAQDAIVVARGRGAPGRIDVRLDPDEPGGVVVSVTDDGCGMSDSVRARCLEPFYTTKSRGMGGTGMGLSLVFGMVGRAGGHIDIRSAPGGGTTVSLHLRGASPAPARPGSSHRSHVTLKDPRTRNVVTALLGSLRHDVVHGPPETGSLDSLWVTDADSATPEQAGAFIGTAPGHRVVVLGGDATWAGAGVVIESPHPPTEQLRRILTARRQAN